MVLFRKLVQKMLFPHFSYTKQTNKGLEKSEKVLFPPGYFIRTTWGELTNSSVKNKRVFNFRRDTVLVGQKGILKFKIFNEFQKTIQNALLVNLGTVV